MGQQRVGEHRVQPLSPSHRRLDGPPRPASTAQPGAAPTHHPESCTRVEGDQLRKGGEGEGAAAPVVTLTAAAMPRGWAAAWGALCGMLRVLLRSCEAGIA